MASLYLKRTTLKCKINIFIEFFKITNFKQGPSKFCAPQIGCFGAVDLVLGPDPNTKIDFQFFFDQPILPHWCPNIKKWDQAKMLVLVNFEKLMARNLTTPNKACEQYASF